MAYSKTFYVFGLLDKIRATYHLIKDENYE